MILSSLFPTTCHFCNETLPHPKQLLCPSCFSLLEFLDPDIHCPQCFTDLYLPCQKRHIYGVYTAALFDSAGPGNALARRREDDPRYLRLLAALFTYQISKLGWPAPEYFLPSPYASAMRTFFPTPKQTTPTDRHTYLLGAHLPDKETLERLTLPTLRECPKRIYALFLTN